MKKLFLHKKVNLIGFILLFFSNLAQALCLNYEDCNSIFLQSLKIIDTNSALNHSHQITIKEYPIPGSGESILTARIHHFKKTKDVPLIIFSSGLHGIEGFVGSFVQSDLLTHYGSEYFPSEYDVLMIHVINPYGLKNGRRTNENNVDLNRNFALSSELYKMKNVDYKSIDSFLNPQGPAEMGLGPFFGFLFQSVRLLYLNGMETLRRAILKGQYQNDRGIYFGGHQLQPEVLAMDQILNEVYLSYKNIIFIDLHSGYGEKGRLHLFPSTENLKARERLKILFKGYPINFGEQENFYQVTGSLTDWVEFKKPLDVKLNTMVFEYGTMNSQSTWGSIQSLYTVILENQSHFFGFKNSSDIEKIQQRSFDLYAPQDPEWESLILKQTHEVLKLFFLNSSSQVESSL